MLNQQNNQNTNKPIRENANTGKNSQALPEIKSGQSLATVALAIGSLIATSPSAQALNIHFDYAANTSLQVRSSFEMAASIWEGLLADNTDVRIEVGMVNFATEYGNGSNGTEDYSKILGLALPKFWEPQNGFQGFQSALAADAKSANDATAVANLNISQDIKNNYDLILTQANAKSLGLYDGSSNTFDGQIRINSAFKWDLDLTPNSGSTGVDQFHYLSVALHEIAHVLGFTSGLDSNDWVTANSEGSATPGITTARNQFTSLDAFRFNENGVLDVAQVTNATAKRYFSINGGANNLAQFSTGENGDGYQASHWKNDKFLDANGNLVVNEMLGIMDPAFGMGERGKVSALDLTALDAIGWDLSGKSWNNLNMDTLAAQASSKAQVSFLQDILTQFAAEKGLAWAWWNRRWAVAENELLAAAGLSSLDQLNQSNQDEAFKTMLSYAATVESFNPNSLPPATSVPEPTTTLALMGVGLLGLRAGRKRRESKSSD
jgi:PEP-CTERM motif